MKHCWWMPDKYMMLAVFATDGLPYEQIVKRKKECESRYNAKVDADH